MKPLEILPPQDIHYLCGFCEAGIPSVHLGARDSSIRGFAHSARPEGFEAVLQAVESARAARRHLEEAQARSAQLAGYLAETRAKLGQVLARCRRSSLTPEPGLPDLEALSLALSEAREMERESEELARDLARVRAEAADLAREAEDKAAQFKGLLSQAGAGDEEEFRRLGAAHQERLSWQHVLEVNDLALLNIAGGPEAKALLESDLGHTDRLKVQEEKDQAMYRLEELKERYSRTTRKSAGCSRNWRIWPKTNAWVPEHQPAHIAVDEPLQQADPVGGALI